MRSLKPVLIILVLIPVLVIGGIKGYMHYKLKHSVDKLVRQSRMFADLSYGSLSTSLNGKLGVHNISIQIHGLDDVIHIDAVEYTPPNLWFMLKDANKVERGELPKSMKLAITGLNLDLYGDITDKLEAVVNQINNEAQGINHLCGGRLFFGPREYREMGYEEMTADMSIGYQYDDLNSEIVIEANTLTHDVGAGKLRAVVAGITDSRITRLMHAKEEPRLSQMKFTYTDKSYVPRFVKMCAKASKLSRQEYINEEVKQKPAYFSNAWGIVPGDGLRAAYKDFLDNPQTIEVSMELPESVALDKIDMFKTEDIPALIDLKVAVNGKAVQNLSFSFDGKSRIDLEDSLSGMFSNKKGKKKKKPLVVKKYDKKLLHFHPVHVSKLRKHIGQYVRLHLDGDKRREGVLVKIQGNILYLSKRMSGGEFSVRVRSSRVKKAEVKEIKN